MEKEMKYTNIYVLPNGEEIEVIESYLGEYIRLHKRREYLSGDSKGQVKETDDWKDIENDDRFQKIEETNMVASLEGNLEVQQVRDTFVLAKRKDHRISKPIEYYSHELAINCRYKTEIKIKLQDEEYKRDIYMEWSGNLSFFDFVENIEDNLWEEIMENGEKHFVRYPDKDRENIYEDNDISLEFYTDEGKYEHIDIPNSRKLAQMIVGIELVDFDIEIFD